ncbi:MAG: hypothetical protein JWO20_626 [Candidatus Angelobacter sp.]|nr:hypothetical protein [Candidatus Angelobacter sp.]
MAHNDQIERGTIAADLHSLSKSKRSRDIIASLLKQHLAREQQGFVVRDTEDALWGFQS